MSFHITVILPHEQYPMPKIEDDLEVWDRWVDQECEFHIYSEPLGSDDFVYHYWCSIAAQLNLPLIAAIYTQGLQIQGEPDLNNLKNELELLAEYWKTHQLEPLKHKQMGPDEIMENLTERMAYFRRAVQIARENNAMLIV